MRFLVDANLPPALADWLTSAGHEADHVSELGMQSAPDRVIWRRACELDACIVTKDEDFVLLHALDRAGPAIVWIRIGNAVREVLLRRVPEIWPALLKRSLTARRWWSRVSLRATCLGRMPSLDSSFRTRML